jgi:hypothetical protein
MADRGGHRCAASPGGWREVKGSISRRSGVKPSSQKDRILPLGSRQPASAGPSWRPSWPQSTAWPARALGMAGISKSQVSRLCAEMDERVRSVLERPIEGLPGRSGVGAPLPNPTGQWYVKVREAGRGAPGRPPEVALGASRASRSRPRSRSPSTATAAARLQENGSTTKSTLVSGRAWRSVPPRPRPSGSSSCASSSGAGSPASRW